MITTYERGIAQGVLQERRQSVMLQLETKFGLLSADVRQRVENLSLDQLRQVQIDILKGQSLKELGLEE